MLERQPSGRVLLMFDLVEELVLSRRDTKKFYDTANKLAAMLLKEGETKAAMRIKEVVEMSRNCSDRPDV